MPDESAMTEAQLAEIERRANGPGGYSAKAYSDRIALLTEVRRLRSLFTARDANLAEGWAQDFLFRPQMKEHYDWLTDLTVRIRAAIGEPERRTTGEE